MKGFVITGKAGAVFNYLALLAKRRGNIKIKELLNGSTSLP